ncbi:hypothetical protein HY572_01220, partial [Candidatus Micrarchaeota archaeon]|nr:hypothetical protein [Candidatus Micrarchaeota archaeon]
MKHVLLVLLLSGLASAVLSVQDFTCNGGLLNIETNVPFNCVAVIFNDDLNSNAALNTVTLTSLNGWTSASSYAGSFSGNSVPRGSSVSVTFSSIIAVSPGTSKTFSDLQINGGSGNAAELADAAMNVVAIKSATLTPSATTVAYGNEFDATISFDLGGQANVTADLELSGCSLSAGQAATKTLGTVSDTTQSTSWKVTQGSGAGASCQITVEVQANADPLLLTSTKTATVSGSGTAPSTPVSNPSTPSTPVAGAPGGGSAGGGGGGG